MSIHPSVPMLVVAALVLGATVRPREVKHATTPQEACSAKGSVFRDETVRVPWTRVRVVNGIEVRYCVLRGHEDAALPFLRNAEHLLFTVSSPGPQEQWITLRLHMRTSARDDIALAPARVRVPPWAAPGCRFDLCERFTGPGERVVAVDAEFLRCGKRKHASHCVSVNTKREETETWHE